MVAIAVLRPEEAEIARAGALPEPSFRPFPGSLRGRESDQRWDLVWAHNGKDVDVGPAVPAVRESFASPVSLTLPRVGAAQHWKRSAREPAFLIARDGEAFYILALGTVEGSARVPIYGVRKLEIRVRYVLGQPIPLEVLITRLDASQRAMLERSIEDQMRPLPPKFGAAVMQSLVELEPDLDAVFRDIRRQVNAENLAKARRPQSTVLVREALSSALHLFVPAWHTLKPEADPMPSSWALELEQLTGRIENDFIADDTVAFPGWDRSVYSRAGWWEFRSKDRRLLVKNINVCRSPDAFVLVQYKLLEKLRDGRLVFRPDGRLDGQVDRMISLEHTPRGSVPDDDPDTYRIGKGFSFVKFILPDAARRDRPGELMPGFYFPSEFVRRVLIKPDIGPQGGVVYFVNDRRHLTPETFARLVRDSWVGSTGDATTQLRTLFGLRDSDADLVLAVDEPIGSAQAE